MTKKNDKVKLTKTERILSWTGLKASLDHLRDIKLPGKQYIQEKRELLAKNLENEEEFEKKKFTEVLQAWGIYNDETMSQYIKSKTREFYVGIFLLFIGIFAMLWQRSGNMAFFLGALSSFACFSIGLLGLLLCVVSFWRLKVLEKQIFFPFIKWLKNMGKFPDEVAPLKKPAVKNRKKD